MISIKDAEGLKSRVHEADIVSFDIFDTLLLRNVIHPTDIFKAVEIEQYNRTNSHTNFYDIRIRAEQQARMNTNYEDITLDEIYVHIENVLGAISEDLQQLELEIEQQFLVANHEMKQIFTLAQQLGKKILIISDMYLPNEVMRQLLQANGYSNYDRLYISGELNATKATGSMYKHIREVEQIASNVDWLHIGDNYQSDVLNANENGLQGYHYRKLSEREDVNNIRTLGDSIVRAIQLNHKYMNDDQDYWYRFGADTVAPVYIGLMWWLIKSLKGKDNIYFLSRDGYIPYKLYKLIQEYYPELQNGEYLYASRRAYVYPHLLHVDQNAALSILMLYNSGFRQALSVREILENIGLNSEQYRDMVSQFNIKSLEVVVEDKNSAHIKEFLCYIWGDIKQVLQQELSMLEEYLEQSEITKFDEVHIFDVGWSGSTHMALRDILDKCVHGYYFGTLESIYPAIKGNSSGYAFNVGNPLKNRNFILSNVMMYELIFTAPEGTLINFSYDHSKKVVPNLKNVEQNEYMYECIQRFQQGAVDIFEQVLVYNKYMNDISTEFALEGMRSFIKAYKATDMLQFAQLTNAVGFGNSRDIKKYVTKVEITEYLANRQLYNKKSHYNLWKHAIVIVDEQGRPLNRYEVERIHNLRRDFTKFEVNKYFLLLKKAIKNPKKAGARILLKIRSAVRSNS